MTFVEIQTEVRSYVAEAEAGFFSDTEIKRWINLAQNDIIVKTECLESMATITKKGSGFALPADALKVKWVLYDNDKLDFFLFADYLKVKNRTEESTVSKYTLRRHNVYLCYAPESANEIDVYYVEIPDKLVDDTDVPLNGERHLYPFHNLLVLYATYRAKIKAREKDEANSYLQEYLAGLETIKMTMTKYQARYIREVEDGE